MIDVNDLRKGVTFLMDNDLYKVLDYHHNKPGRGNATIKIKARNIRSGTTLEKTFQSGERIQDVRLDFHNVQYLYGDGEYFHFMDLQTYEQPAIHHKIIGEASGFLKEGMEVKLTFYDNDPIDIELPMTVDLRVVHANASVRGDTATGVTKRVKVETGAEVECPQFVNEGDFIRIDTRDGTYVTRVSA